MDIANLTLAAAFVVGLAHTLEPCEDKAIVALVVFWATKKLVHAVGLVVLYGLGMALADTVMGFVLSYIGVTWLDALKTPLEVTAGAITLVFGFLMLVISYCYSFLFSCRSFTPSNIFIRAALGTTNLRRPHLMVGSCPSRALS